MKTKRLLKVSLMLFAFSAAVLFLCLMSNDFAELYCNSLSAFFRFVFSLVTGFFVFSVAELVVILLIPCMIAAVIIIIVFAVKKSPRLKNFLRMAVSSVILAAVVFFNNFAVCYLRKPIDENMGFKRHSLTAGELNSSASGVKNLLETSLDNITFSENGASVNPHSWETASSLIDRGYDRLGREYRFITPIYAVPKKIAFSPFLTYTHISGMYFPFTGEANVNTNYPDYVVVFAMAHEKAHQRGIASEDEANFIAALALLASGDDYLCYSSLLNVYDYYLDAMYRNDKEMYKKYIENTHTKILGEYIAYSEFFDKYRNSDASKLAESVNDTYIKSMGDSDGVDSYGKVVELFLAFMKSKNGLPY